MTAELKELGLDVGHRRVGRLMRQNGLCAVRTRKYKATTDSNHGFNIAPNVLNRDFMADAPNQKWAGDISYVWTREGWLYLAVMLALHSRRVIGWAVSNRLNVTWQYEPWIWQLLCASRRRVAFIIPTAAVSIVRTIIRNGYANTASKSQ